MSFKKEHPDYLSYTSNLFYLNELPNNFQSAFEGFLLRYGNNAQQLKFLINKMGTVILKESTSNWGYDYLLNDLKDYTYDLCNKEFSKVMDYISLLYEQSIMTQEEINDFLEEQNIGYLISYSSLGSSWVLREEIDNISESTNLAINEVLDICKQTLSHLEQAKNNIANNHNARARKDSIRDCLSAMESLLKNITNTNDIKLATKSLRVSNEYGPDIIVKDGLSIWNKMHELYPDIRHGNPEESQLTSYEASFWIDRINSFTVYICKVYKDLEKQNKMKLSNKVDNEIIKNFMK